MNLFPLVHGGVARVLRTARAALAAAGGDEGGGRADARQDASAPAEYSFECVAVTLRTCMMSARGGSS
jgi:hypothetical protein